MTTGGFAFSPYVSRRMRSRRLPPVWSIEELNDACFVVRDNNGHQLAYVYFEDEPGQQWLHEAWSLVRGPVQQDRPMQTPRWPFRIGIAFPSCALPLQVSDPLPIVDGHAD